jgi:uncharacterized protein YdbL (DUF1318 family)
MTATRTIPTLLLCVALLAASARAAVSLDAAQKQTLLGEAARAYADAAALSAADPAAARTLYRDSAEKYDILARAGCDNGALLMNLGLARLRAGQLGRAIAAFHRAKIELGQTPQIDRALAEARSARDGAGPLTSRPDLAGQVDSIVARIPLNWQVIFALAAWAVFWLAVAGAVFLGHFPFKAVWIPAGLIVLVLSGSILWQVMRTEPGAMGVVVDEPAILRSGAGASFAPAAAEPLLPGQEFRIERRSGGWVEVRLSDGRIGWLEASQTELIPPAKLMQLLS